VTGRLRRWLGSTAADSLVRVLMIAILIGGIALAVKVERQSDCLTQYVEKSARGTEQRSKAAEEDRKAVDKVFDSFANAKSGADARTALAEYLATRKAADEKRRLNPAPPPPSELCG
jgi:hypothetical protein